MRLLLRSMPPFEAISASEQLAALDNALRKMPQGYTSANLFQFFFALGAFLKRLNKAYPHAEPLSSKMTTGECSTHVYIFRKGCKDKERRSLYDWEFVDSSISFPQFYYNQLCGGAGIDFDGSEMDSMSQVYLAGKKR